MIYGFKALYVGFVLGCLALLTTSTNAQDQEDHSIFAEGPRQTVVVENGVSAWKFTSRTGSVALVQFRKHNGEDAFAVHVTDWDSFHMKTGWLYFSRTTVSFESDDDKQRNVDAPLSDVKKVKGQKNYMGWNYLVIKIRGKEKRFMINFDPVPQSRSGPWGVHQKAVFELIKHLFEDYNAVASDFQEQLAKLPPKSGVTISNSSDRVSETPKPPLAEAVNVEILSEPSGAEIYVDGVFSSSTPSKLSLSLGEHSIRVSRPGFKQWERRILIDGTSTKTLNAILEKTESQ
jgi:PEGA domain-containing protein